VVKGSKFAFLKGSPTTSDHVSDVVESVKQYARQETIEPLRGALRWLAFGIAGALAIGLGLVLVVLGVLRLSQDFLSSQLNGAWTFVHYVIAAVFSLVVVVLALSRVQKKSLNRGGQ
jgi:uncharacterized membrane protein